VGVDVISRLVVRNFAGQEVEFAAIRFLDRVTMNDVFWVSVDMHMSIDADQLVAFTSERHEVVGHRDDGQ
jgi:hypothetical protein